MRLLIVLLDYLLSSDGSTVHNQTVEDVVSLSQGGGGSKKRCKGECLHSGGAVKKSMTGVVSEKCCSLFLEVR